MNYEIDIIMGIYNCEKYLEESIKSILNQSYNKWRLIMCDDGSTDNTHNIAKKYSNEYRDKIIVLRNKKNMGLNYTLNKCIRYSDAKYIARMDGDDTCSPKRLEKEFDFLENNHEYSFVSVNMSLFDENGKWGKTRSEKEPDNKNFIKGSPFCHAGVMIRSDDLKSVGGYTIDKRLLRVEDYHLWVKLYKNGYKGYNIQEELYNMRDDRNAIKRRTWQNRKNEYYVRNIAYKMLNIQWYYRFYKYRPIILGLIPKTIYKYLHRKRLSKENEK